MKKIMGKIFNLCCKYGETDKTNSRSIYEILYTFYLIQASLITFDREARLKASLNEHRRVEGIMEELHTTSSFFGNLLHVVFCKFTTTFSQHVLCIDYK